MEKLSHDGVLGTETVKEKRISGNNQILDSKNALKKKKKKKKKQNAAHITFVVQSLSLDILE